MGLPAYRGGACEPLAGMTAPHPVHPSRDRSGQRSRSGIGEGLACPATPRLFDARDGGMLADGRFKICPHVQEDYLN